MTRIETTNATASYLIYRQVVISAMYRDGYKREDSWFRKHNDKFNRAFNHGEPAWMLIDELKLIADHDSIRRTKTPREMALRVVTISNA